MIRNNGININPMNKNGMNGFPTSLPPPVSSLTLPEESHSQSVGHSMITRSKTRKMVSIPEDEGLQLSQVPRHRQFQQNNIEMELVAVPVQAEPKATCRPRWRSANPFALRKNRAPSAECDETRFQFPPAFRTLLLEVAVDSTTKRILRRDSADSFGTPSRPQ